MTASINDSIICEYAHVAPNWTVQYSAELLCSQLAVTNNVSWFNEQFDATQK